MKITGLGVRLVEGSFVINIEARLGTNAALEADDMARLVDMINEAAGGLPQTSDPKMQALRDAMAADPSIKAQNEVFAEPEAAPATRRRRAAAPTEDRQEAKAAELAEGYSEPQPRRRRSTTDASTAAPTAEPSKPTPTDASPVSRRRRREENPTEAGSTTSSPESVGPVEGRRRRRSASDAQASSTTTETGASTGSRRTRTTTSPSEDDEITDADLSKACSAAARVILPKGVMEILGEFGVENSQSIAQKDRREFLDALKEASEA